MLDGVRLTEIAKVEAARLMRFFGVGFLNTMLGGAAIGVLQFGVGLSPRLANGGGFAIGIPCGFLLNRYFVFEQGKTAGAAAARYAAGVVLAFIVNQLVLTVFSSAMTSSVGAIVGQFCALATYTLTLYLTCRLWVFGTANRKPTG